MSRWSGTIEERFWARVDKNGPMADLALGRCWVWLGPKDADGYGRHGGRLAHRFASGTMAPELDHLCRNRACVRPSHLEAVDHAENIRRGDFSSNGSWHRVKTHCPHGHEYTPENTRVYRGKRNCRACNAARLVARRAYDGPAQDQH